MNALQKLKNKNQENKYICVGLDTDITKIPDHLLSSEDPIFEFNKSIIEATSSYAASYKLNFAFYESEGIKGLTSLEKTLEIIPQDILTIGDAKRGDIGNTSSMYAKSIFEHFNLDSITLHPYMGEDSLSPFLQYENKLNFVLALTSNPGAYDFEKLKLDNGEFLFQRVISKVKSWNGRNNCGIVFGATKTSELNENINLFEGLPVLLPGVGAQGGSLVDVVLAFKGSKCPYLINVSRGIIYKSSNKDFAEKAEEEIKEMNNQIISLLNR